jgi:hypothetical protein
MQKLTINNQTADLPQNQTVALTKRIVNWEKLESHSANYSNTITLPYSKTNNQIFQSAFDPASDSTDLRKFYEIQYIQDYNEIISFGKGKLITADKNGYKFAMYWGNINLKDALEGKSIQELDLTDLNHVWNLTNVLEWYVVFPDISYPIVDLSVIGENLLEEGTASFPIKAYRLIPFIRADRIIEQIATDNGLIFNGISGLEQIPVASKKLQPFSNFEVGVNDFKEVYADIYSAGEINYYRIFNLLFDKIVSDPLSNFDTAQNLLDGTMYTNTAASTQTLRFSLFISLLFKTQNLEIKGVSNIKFIFEKWDGVAWATEKETLYYSSLTTPPTPPIVFSDYLKFVELPEQEHEAVLLPNESMRARVEFYFYSDFDQNLSIELSTTTYFKTSTNDMSFGDPWQIASNLPNISQYDFLKEMCFLRGLIFSNVKDNVFEFTKVTDIINAEAQDFSDKFISLDIENIHTSLSQVNDLKFNNDATVEADLGSHTFRINNNTLKQRSDYYVSKFGASGFREWAGERVMRLPILKTSEPKWQKVNNRITTFRNKTDLYFTDDVTTELAPGFKTIAEHDGFTMESVWRGGYAEYETLMNNFKRCKMILNLSQNDFEAIDLKRPIFVKQAAGKYIIEEIKSFVAGTPTELIVLKL